MTARPAIACDVDGVVWLAGRPIDGAAEACRLLSSSGFDVWFVTNNSSATHAELDAGFRRAGIEADGRIATSADAAALLVGPGARVLVGGEGGVMAALRDGGCEVVPVADAAETGAHERFDAVVVGIHRSFDYSGLATLSRHVREGARFVATNDDPTYPSPHGLLPGGGSIVAAVASAAGRVPEVAGKPHQAMVAVVRERLGGASPRWVIGDRESTDGRFAKALGARFAHVSSEVRESGASASACSVPSLLEAARAIVSAG